MIGAKHYIEQILLFLGTPLIWADYRILLAKNPKFVDAEIGVRIHYLLCPGTYHTSENFHSPDHIRNLSRPLDIRFLGTYLFKEIGQILTLKLLGMGPITGGPTAMPL